MSLSFEGTGGGFLSRVAIVISKLSTQARPWRGYGLLAMIASLILGGGCGSSETAVVKTTTPGAGKLIKKFDPVQPTGRGKRKEELSRRERMKLLREASAKLKEQGQ
jgi:hypothetical protein